MKYTKTSSGRMAVSAKIVLAASRSFTGRSPTLDPSRGVARRQDVPSLFPSVPGAGARDKAEKGPRHSAELRQNILKNWNTREGVSFARALLAATTEWSRERRAHNR